MTEDRLDILSHHLPSPIQPLDLSPWIKNKVKVYIKRDDLIHPLISGNKWRKLKYNLLELPNQNPPLIVSFGGAFSNHIHALAAACQILNLSSISFIRGEWDEKNPTLSFCHKAGMKLIPISRSEYRLKEKSDVVQDYLKNLSHYHIIPEGGSNKKALKGVKEIIDEIHTAEFNPHYIALSAGTGGTAAGLLSHPHLKSRILAFSALKSNHLFNEIQQLSDESNLENLTVNTDYHWGGYAKYDNKLLSFLSEFEDHTGIPLDHVYNGKALWGLMDLINKDYFSPSDKILYLHTGGLQGKAGIKHLNN